MSQYRQIKLSTKYTHVFECLVMVVCGLFEEICWLTTLSNMIVFARKKFGQKCFSKIGMTIRNPKKI